MAKVLIIGCGAIAYRHLQSLISTEKPYSKPISIYLYDKYKSPEQLHHEFVDFQPYLEIISLESLYLTSFDLVIVCSGAGLRTEYNYNNLQADFILIEKPIANSVSELMQLKIDDRCHVHLPFRSFHLADILKSSNGSLNTSVTGMNFATLCNVWHFYDFVSYVRCTEPTKIQFCDCKEVRSKRAGYVDLTGNINIEYANSDTLSICDLIPSDKVKDINRFSEYRLDSFVTEAQNYQFDNGRLIGKLGEYDRYEYVSELPSILENKLQSRFVKVKEIFEQSKFLLQTIESHFGRSIYHT